MLMGVGLNRVDVGRESKYRRYDYGRLFQRDTRNRCGDGGPCCWDDNVFLHPDGSICS